MLHIEGLERWAITLALCLSFVSTPTRTFAQTLEVVHRFDWQTAPDASRDWPAVRSALVQHPDGALYGVGCNAGTTSGDPYRSGMVFRVLQPSGIAVVHEFESTTEGLCPDGLTLGDSGYLYGTTKFGGSLGGGTAFRLSPSGDLVVLHSFVAGTEGQAPEAPLVYASDGNFYGSTTSGGASSAGTVFRMTPGGTVTVLHSFAGSSDGAGTKYPMIQARDGNIYGTTTSSAFTLTLSGTFSVLSRVSNGAVSGLVEGDDALYGLAKVTYFISPHTNGYSVYLYRLLPSGDFHQFSNSVGSVSQGDTLAGAGEFTLSPAADGTFIATASTYYFFSAGSSSVYLASPSGTFELLGQLDSQLGPITTPLARGTDGNFYGGTSGLLVSGVVPLSAAVFRFIPARLSPTATISMAGTHVRLTWTPVAGALSYTIRRVSTSGIELVTSVTGNEFVDEAVEPAQHYRYVVTVSTVLGFSADSNEVVATPGRWVPGDFDGDRRADVAIYRPSRGAWYSRNSTTGYVVGAGNWQFEWGAPGDVTIEADFDDDGILDPTLYRPSTGQWFILYSTRAYNPEQFGFFEWGTTGDVPITADFDGDNKADIGVYRPSTGYWYIRHSSTGYPVGNGNWLFQWGAPGDIPEVGDFDGDGYADIAVYRPSTGQWFIRTSSTQFNLSADRYIAWGTSSDIPMVADFDGDGKTDVGVYRPSTGYWYLRLSAQGFRESAGNWIFQWGATGDQPRAIDLDGDGAADIAVYRPTTGQWFIRYSSRGYNTSQFGYFQWGATGDLALP